MSFRKRSWLLNCCAVFLIAGLAFATDPTHATGGSGGDDGGDNHPLGGLGKKPNGTYAPPSESDGEDGDAGGDGSGNQTNDDEYLSGYGSGSPDNGFGSSKDGECGTGGPSGDGGAAGWDQVDNEIETGSDAIAIGGNGEYGGFGFDATDGGAYGGGGGGGGQGGSGGNAWATSSGNGNATATGGLGAYGGRGGHGGYGWRSGGNGGCGGNSGEGGHSYALCSYGVAKAIPGDATWGGDGGNGGNATIHRTQHGGFHLPIWLTDDGFPGQAGLGGDNMNIEGGNSWEKDNHHGPVTGSGADPASGQDGQNGQKI